MFLLKLIGVDEKLREVKVRVDTEDDLWVIYNLLSGGDVIKAKTSRELKTRSGSRRKPMTLAVKAERFELQPFTSRLRVHGIIVEGPKELDLVGQRHTLSLDVGREFTIRREEGWSEAELGRIREAVRRSTARVLIVGVDDEEVCIAFLRDYGVEKVAELRVSLPGKMYQEDRERILMVKMAEAARMVEEACERFKADALVLAGPGFVKEALKEALKGLKDVSVYLEDASTGGLKGVYEAIKRGVVTRIVKDYSLVEEERLMEEFMSKLAADERLVAYGLGHVETCINAGAVGKLMVISELLRAEDQELRLKVENLVRMAEGRRARVKIFSSLHDTYHWLKSLGGIAAILRYPVEPPKHTVQPGGGKAFRRL